MNIFSENKFYPNEEVPLNEHFAKFYESVYVTFLPFFQIDNKSKSTSYKASNQVSVEQAKTEMKELEQLKLDNAEIFFPNEEYPKDKEIYENGAPVKWKEIIDNSKLSDIIELNRALKTSISSYNKKLERQDLLKILNDYTDTNRIWHPSEGCFDIFTKKKIYQSFKNFHKDKIVVIDEFFEKTIELDLTKLSELEFIDKIHYQDYYIYSNDREILFTIDWDSYFYLIAVNQDKLKYIKDHFEGFTANEKTTHLWDWKEGEIIAKLNSKTSSERKSWRKRIMN